MRLAVLVKQVPATDNVKIDENTGTMVREGVESELNPLDLYAVEEAVRIKERLGEDTELTVISMGPTSAVEAIKEAIAMGCDRGYLLCDRRFAGADTLATAYALSAALRKLGPFDLILAGLRATDGETGQVGPSVAAQLGVPVLTYVSKIEDLASGSIRVERTVEGGVEIVECGLPAVVTVVKAINEPRVPSFKGKMKAKRAEIPLLTPDDIDADPGRLGLFGSPTRVVKVFRPKLARQCTMVTATDPAQAAERIFQFLKQRSLV